MNRRFRLIVLVTAAAAAAAACDSSGTKPAAASRHVGGTPAPSSVSAPPSAAASGIYRTQQFLPGLRLVLPTGWEVKDDVFAELTLISAKFPGARVRLSKGLFPVDTGGGFLTTRISPAAVVAALRANSALSVAGVGAARLGDNLRARTVDISAAPAAPRRFQYLAYKGVGNLDAFEIARGSTARVYVAKVRQGFGPDLLNLAAETPHPADFRALTRAAGALLGTLRLPAGIKAAA